MDPFRVAAGLDVLSAPNAVPLKAKTKPAMANVELAKLSHQDRHVDYASHDNSSTPAAPVTPSEARTHPSTGFQTPPTPSGLEASTPPGFPNQSNVARVVPSFSYPPLNKYRVLCACLTYFVNGMNDSAAGPLIPYIESDYRIGYAVVSLIFVTMAAGFIITSFAVDAIQSKLGRARTLMTSEAIFLVGYVMIACTPPFPVVVVAYFFIGLGYAINLALNNVFAANMANQTVILGAAHGSYGLGGVVCPIIATAMVSRGILWSRFFLIPLALRVGIVFFTGWANRGYESEPTSQFSAGLEQIASRQRAEHGEPTKWQLLKRALKNKTTIIGAIFIFAYQGAEVSISGWVISYLISSRGGDPYKVGFVTAGFWGGITLGRFVLSHATPRVGEKLSVYILLGGALAFQLLVWLVPNVITEAVAVSIEGLLLGPVYPSTQTIFTRLLPANIQMTSISFISSAGSSGGAVVPLIVGLASASAGTWVLHPICISMFAVMTACLLLLPKVVKPTE